MFTLIDCLSELDNKRITNYITEWGVKEGYVGNASYLKYWGKEKIKLYKMLGNQLILKIPYSYNKTESQTKKELGEVYDKYSSNLFYSIDAKLEKLVDEGKITYEVKRPLRRVFSWDAFVSNTTLDNIKFKMEGKKNTLQLQKNMKTIRAMQSIIQYFEFDDLKEVFEKVRIEQSLVFNEKIVKGNLCFSVHPLDFITMSDNSSSWSSCMSWKSTGCYHVGTVEMMNSNNVICAYIEGKEDFAFGRQKNIDHVGEEWSWNNKKWRQLFYVTKDIIVCGKSYPFVNKEITLKALDILRRLAEKNLNWTYTYGPEVYNDMKHIGSNIAMKNNRTWIANKQTIKHNIIFDSAGMYNDMFNDKSYTFYCIRNKVKKNKLISYSGKAPCACCMNSVIAEAWDGGDDDEAYNDRYENVNHIICYDCGELRRCNQCGNETLYSITKEFNNELYCENCWNEMIRKCPCCGEPFKVLQWNKKNKIIIKSDKLRYLQDIRSQEIDEGLECYCVCENCLKKKVLEGIIEYDFLPIDPNRNWYPWENIQYYFTTNKFNKNDLDLDKYKYENLESFNWEDYPY